MLRPGPSPRAGSGFCTAGLSTTRWKADGQTDEVDYDIATDVHSTARNSPSNSHESNTDGQSGSAGSNALYSQLAKHFCDVADVSIMFYSTTILIMDHTRVQLYRFERCLERFLISNTMDIVDPSDLRKFVAFFISLHKMSGSDLGVSNSLFGGI